MLEYLLFQIIQINACSIQPQIIELQVISKLNLIHLSAVGQQQQIFPGEYSALKERLFFYRWSSFDLHVYNTSTMRLTRYFYHHCTCAHKSHLTLLKEHALNEKKSHIINFLSYCLSFPDTLVPCQLPHSSQQSISSPFTLNH